MSFDIVISTLLLPNKIRQKEVMIGSGLQ